MASILNWVEEKGKKSRELRPQGVWVSLEDGVEMLTPTGLYEGKEDEVEIVGSTTGLSNMKDDEVEIIDSFEGFKRKNQLSQTNSFSSTKRQREAHNLPSEGIASTCGHHKLGGSFGTNCQHQTCRLCLKCHVASLIEKSLEIFEPSYEHLRLQLLCLNQRCGLELSKADLIDLLDIHTVQTYENWLRNAYNHLYGPTLSPDMIDCINCQQKAAIISTRMSSIKGKGKATLSFGNMQSPPSWVCTKCEVSWCAACGSSCGSFCEENGSAVNHVCREATNYRIYKIMADLQLIYSEYSKGIETSSTNLVKSYHNSSKYKRMTGGVDTGFSGLSEKAYGRKYTGTVWGAGTGFGGNKCEHKSVEENARKVEEELDSRAQNVLASLTAILENMNMNQCQPSLGMSACVLLGRENICGQLLQYFMTNDSMMDICARGGLYHQLASLLTVMKQYPELFRMLMGSYLQNDTNGNTIANGSFGSDSSVIKKMKNIYEQSKIILNKFKGGNNDENVEANVSIARCLLKCYEELAIAAGKQMSATTLTTSVSVEDNEATLNLCMNVSVYKQSLKALQFQEFPMIGTGLHCHTYNNYLTGSGTNQQSIDNSGVHNKKRMMHILKEVASLATSLPLEWESSIHVRVDPVRMDALKALIVGPKGTPYQNGIFIFDICLPPDYPQVPPWVTFLTTGCGQVRFNPNLYNDGKVCLSLLGTWQGPGWQPWKSTLLQVLVSIQSLIFVEDPYYNEPGRESMINSRAAAEAENKVQRDNTLRIAILGALRNPDSCFKDVITEHFLMKKQEIAEQCSEWVQAIQATCQQMYCSTAQIADEIILELAKLSSIMFKK